MTDFQKAKLDISIQSIDFAHGGKKSRSTAWETLVGVLPLTILLFALGWYSYNSIVHYLGAGRDDTFIVLWTGMSLAEGHGLVNYNLEPTEMTSSILHTAIVAVLYMAAPDFVYTLNKLLGLLAGALVLIILYQRRQDLFGGKTAGTIAFAISVVALANSRAWLYWNMGGLENSLPGTYPFCIWPGTRRLFENTAQGISTGDPANTVYPGKARRISADSVHKFMHTFPKTNSRAPSP